MIPVECIPGNEPEPEDQSREDTRAEVLDSLLWAIQYVARFKRPGIALDVLAVATGLIFNPDEASIAIAAKWNISPRAFTRLVSRAQRQCFHLRKPESR
jgi:hypothetical protein